MYVANKVRFYRIFFLTRNSGTKRGGREEERCRKKKAKRKRKRKSCFRLVKVDKEEAEENVKKFFVYFSFVAPISVAMAAATAACIVSNHLAPLPSQQPAFCVSSSFFWVGRKRVCVYLLALLLPAYGNMRSLRLCVWFCFNVFIKGRFSHWNVKSFAVFAQSPSPRNVAPLLVSGKMRRLPRTECERTKQQANM